jgi:thiamine-monophosphate kinase
VGRRHGGDDYRRLPVAGRRDRQNAAEGTNRDDQRGDQHYPWRAIVVSHVYTPRSRRTRTYRVGRSTGGGVGSGESDRTLGELGELGEFGVIEGLIRGRLQSADVAVGPGDDGAVVIAADGRVVVSTDMLVEGRHFRLDWSTPHDVGRKAMAQNAADIEAMGARVTAFVVGLGAPPQTPTAQVNALADGMWEEAGRIGAGIVGGDLVSSPHWVVSVTVLGDLAGRAPVLRSGARPGSQLAVVGQLGYSAAGYALWNNNIDQFKDFRELQEFRRRHLVPQPPYRQGRLAAEVGAQAMIDVSDGLVGDLRHLADASGVGIDLSTEALSADRQILAGAAEAVGVDPWTWVFGGGEDHALVAAFAGPVPAGWRVIGRVLDGPARVLVDGSDWDGYAGWQSFSR